MCRHLTAVRDTALLSVLYSTGCRVSEVAVMRWIDISPEGLSIRVSGKGSKLRDCALAGSTVQHLDQWKDQQAEAGHAGLKSEGYIFTSQKGSRLKRESVFKIVNENAVAAGLPAWVTPHCIRHSCATTLIERGMDLSFLSKLLGHSSISTTGIYLHMSKASMLQAHQKHHPLNQMNVATL